MGRSSGERDEWPAGGFLEYQRRVKHLERHQIPKDQGTMEEEVKKRCSSVNS